MSDTYETYGVVTDAQTVLTVVVYLGSLLDHDDINVHYDTPAAVGVEVPWIYTENMSTHTQTWEADYPIQCHQVAGFQQHVYSQAGDFCIFPSRAVHQSCVISKTLGQRDYKVSMFFAIAEPNRPGTEWINAFGCATKKE